ncbi:MAG: hypothetical protein IJZ83_01685 [Clostridia bacterium]|nr:hypothetical protein [Clostridia bacterium]
MLKNKLMRIILVVGSALIIVGVSLMGWLLATEDERGVIEVKLEEGETESLAFEDLTLIPGEECEYTVQLEKTSASKYDLELDFVDSDEEKTLKKYARVKIVADGEVISDELLADAFEKEKIVLPVDFDDKKNTELKIVYYLPLDVGNEAKNAEAVFELLLTASNE